MTRTFEVKEREVAEESNKKIEDLERRIHRHQKSTKTLFSFAVPFHNGLLLRSGLYRRWHLFSFASAIHWFSLFVSGVLVATVLSSVLLPQENYVFASTDSARSGGTFVTDNSNGGLETWADHSNASVSDNVYASGYGGMMMLSSYFKATNFNFAIPDGATINGIKLEIERYSGMYAGSGVKDNTVSLVKGGIISGDNKALVPAWATSDSNTYTTYGGAADLWGETWTPANINSSNFGIVLAVNYYDAGPLYAYIDHLQITVTYTGGTPSVQFTATSGTGSESTTTKNIEVSLSGVSASDVDVDFAVTGGTATGGGVDYSISTSSPLTIPAGETMANIVLNIVNDTLDEPDETISFGISNPVNATLGVNTTYDYAILDDDSPPTVAFQSASSNGSESTTPASLTVNLSTASAKIITVDYATSNGTAIAGSDYTAASGTLTFNSGQTSKTIDIAITNESTIEDNETFTVTLSNPLNATLGASDTHTYTINNDDALPSYIITASVGANGTISPSGSVSVTSGQDQTFTMTPGAGYHLASLTVDSVLVAAAETYTFNNVTTTHTISATFAVDTYTITASASGNGTTSPSGSVSVEFGQNQAFALTPAAGYHLAQLLIDGVATPTCASYTFANITADHTIAATFSIDTFTITASAGSAGGSISPSGAISKNYGENQEFSIVPDAGYHLQDLLLNGVSVGASGTYTLSDIKADYTLSAVFALDPVSTPSQTLFILSPRDNFTYQAFSDFVLTWVHNSGELQANTDHYRILYSTDNRTYSSIQNEVSPSTSSVSLNLDSLACSLLDGAYFKLEAMNSRGALLESRTIFGTFALPEAAPSITSEGNVLDTLSLDQEEVKALQPDLMAMPENKSLGQYGTFNWQADPLAGKFTDNIFSASTSLGTYPKGISLAATLCGTHYTKTLNVSVTAKTSEAAQPTVENQGGLIGTIKEGGDLFASGIEKMVNRITETLNVSKNEVTVVSSTAAVVGVGVASVAAPISNLASLFSFPEYLRSLWYSLLAVGTIRRRKKWGQAVEFGTNLPINQAKIELIKSNDTTSALAGSGQIVATTYTDKLGHYGFIAQPGNYTLRISKQLYRVIAPNWQYYTPNSVLQVKSENESLIVPTIALALDETKLIQHSNYINRLGFFERIMPYISIAFLLLGTLVSLDAIVKTHSITTIGMLIVYIILWVVNVKSLRKKSPWGNVVEEQDQKGIPLALIRIMDKDGKRLIRTSVTNQDGKFSALVQKGEYQVAVSKAGYKPTAPVGISTNSELGAISRKIELLKDS